MIETWFINVRIHRFTTYFIQRIIPLYRESNVINFSHNKIFKGSPDPSHYIFEINVGKMRIRHRTTLNLNLQTILSRSKKLSFNFRVVACRIRLFPTLISKIKWLWYELPLTRPFDLSERKVLQ